MSPPEQHPGEESFATIFTPLGVYQRPLCEPLYYIRLRGEVCGYRLNTMRGLQFLMHLLPDAAHWRAQFPQTRCPRKIDTHASTAWLIGLIQAAGKYDPPEELRPRNNGRPRLTTVSSTQT